MSGRAVLSKWYRTIKDVDRSVDCQRCGGKPDVFVGISTHDYERDVELVSILCRGCIEFALTLFDLDDLDKPANAVS